MSTELSSDDEGKPVVYEGETVGRVVEVEGGTAHVDPDPGVTDTIQSKLGWGEAAADTVPIHPDSVEAVTDDELRIDVAE